MSPDKFEIAAFLFLQIYSKANNSCSREVTLEQLGLVLIVLAVVRGRRCRVKIRVNVSWPSAGIKRNQGGSTVNKAVNQHFI